MYNYLFPGIWFTSYTSFPICCLTGNRLSSVVMFLLSVDSFWVILFTANSLSSSNFCTCVGGMSRSLCANCHLRWDTVPFPIDVIYSYLCIDEGNITFIWWLSYDLPVRAKKKKEQSLFPMFGLVGSFTTDGFLIFIPACCFSPFPSPPLPPSSPSPVRWGALLGWGWLHSIPSTLRVVRVMSHTRLTSHMHGQTCGLDVGGSV